MPETSESISIYKDWFEAAGFQQEGPVYDAINAGRQRFSSATDIDTKTLITRISGWVISAFTIPNAMVERWPNSVRQRLNDSSTRSPRRSLPFETWARPRNIEKREQAISVWSSLLVFLVFHWHDYGADGALEAMGLHMSSRLKDFVDTIRIYAELRVRFRRAFAQTVKEFFTIVIMDADATPKTNPLLWWLAILIQTEVLETQPRWEIAEIRDMLDFPGKLEAIDHYSRVLILDYAYHHWMYDKSPQGAPDSVKIKVTESLDAISIDWVDQDQERPHVDLLEEIRMYPSSAWTLCHSYIDPILTQWLTDQSTGPICDVIKLRRKKLVLFKQRKRYCIKLEIYEDFTTDPCIADCYPARVVTKMTVDEANKAARKALRDELGGKNDARLWHEVYDGDGRVRIRAVYKDLGNNAKAIAWVEEEVFDEPIKDEGDEHMEDSDGMNLDDSEDDRVSETPLHNAPGRS